MAADFDIRVSVCGVSELDGFRTAGVTHVLSLLDPGTAEPAAFRGFPPHGRERLFFHDVVGEYPGFDAPEASHVAAILAFGERLRAEGPEQPPEQPHVLVHCFMGISRSTAAAAILLTQARPGSERAAFEQVFAVRPRAWPNTRLVALADAQLARGGALVEALKQHRRRVIAAYPDIPDLVRSVGRGDELP